MTKPTFGFTLTDFYYQSITFAEVIKFVYSIKQFMLYQSVTFLYSCFNDEGPESPKHFVTLGDELGHSEVDSFLPDTLMRVFRKTAARVTPIAHTRQKGPVQAQAARLVAVSEWIEERLTRIMRKS